MECGSTDFGIAVGVDQRIDLLSGLAPRAVDGIVRFVVRQVFWVEDGGDGVALTVFHRGKDGNKINSGWLIEQAGFKGKLIHGIRVNDKACLVLINESATSFNDLMKAREEIVSKVYDKFGYWLQQEPVEIVS